MPETIQPFRPYYELDNDGNSYEFTSVEQAERNSEALVGALQGQRDRYRFEDIRKNPYAFDMYLVEYDEAIGAEINGRPVDQSEFMVFAAYRFQRARAIEKYLNRAKLEGVAVGEQRAKNLQEMWFNDLAEAQQAAATAIYRCGENTEMRREIAALCVAIGATGWNGDVRDNLIRLRAGSGFSDKKEENKVLGLLRGVTSQAAAIEVVEKILDADTYSPRTDIDGRHGIDMGACSRDSTDGKIDTIIQVKAHEKFETDLGLEITPVAIDEDERLPYVKTGSSENADDYDDWKDQQRELALGKLQSGGFWLKKQRFEFVDNERLTALLVVLRSSPYGEDFEYWQDGEGYMIPGFDISTGLCNDALRYQVGQNKEPILSELKSMREKTRKITKGRIPRKAGV